MASTPVPPPQVNDWQTVEHPAVTDWQDATAPNPFAKYQQPLPTAGDGGGDPFAKYQQPAAPTRNWLDEVGSYFGGAGKEAVETAKGIVPGINQAFYHPIDTIKNIGQAQGNLLQKAEDAFKAKDYATGVRHSIEYLLPVIGSKLSELGDEAGSGKPGSMADALGRTTTLGVGMAAPVVAPLAADAVKTAGTNTLRRMIPNVNNPTEEAALASVEPTVDMSVGQRTGQAGLQRVESGLENFPGSASRAQKFYANQADQLAATGGDIAASAGGQQTNAVGAGQAIGQRLAQRVSRLKSQANKFYDDVRASTAANQQTMQTGTAPMLGQNGQPLVGPTGQPIQAATTQTFETPVEMQPYRTALQPVYDDLMRAMPVARREASPAFAALSNLVNDPAPYMNAMDFDKSLGAIKAIARNGDNPYLTSQSQGIAKQMVAQGEKQLQTALNTAGPKVAAKLQSARGMVKSYYDTGELMADLNDEPAALYQNLVTGGDRSFNTLTTLKTLAPHELQTVGRTFLDGLMEKATKEGGFSRAPGIYADWNRVGPEAKKLLFGPQLTDDVDKFLLAAKRLTAPQNPSGSAHMVAALHGLGAFGTAVAALMSGNPAMALLPIGEASVGPYAASRFLFNSNNARLLTQALRAGPQSPVFSRLATTLNARFLQANQQPAPPIQTAPEVKQEQVSTPTPVAAAAPDLEPKQESTAAPITPAGPTTGSSSPVEPPEEKDAKPPPEVLAALPPGIHTFHNGQRWQKNYDGTASRVSGNSASLEPPEQVGVGRPRRLVPPSQPSDSQGTPVVPAVNGAGANKTAPRSLVQGLPLAAAKSLARRHLGIRASSTRPASDFGSPAPFQ